MRRLLWGRQGRRVLGEDIKGREVVRVPRGIVVMEVRGHVRGLDDSRTREGRLSGGGVGREEREEPVRSSVRGGARVVVVVGIGIGWG